MTARCDVYWQMYLLQEATSGRHDALLYVHIDHRSVFDSNTSLSFPTMTSYYREDGIRHRTKYPSSTPRKVQFVRPVPSQLNKQRLRIQKFQRRWNSIKQDLPPQLSRRHSECILTKQFSFESRLAVMELFSWNDIDWRCHWDWVIPRIRGKITRPTFDCLLTRTPRNDRAHCDMADL